jgi:hypothetical protein
MNQRVSPACQILGVSSFRFLTEREIICSTIGRRELPCAWARSNVDLSDTFSNLDQDANGRRHDSTLICALQTDSLASKGYGTSPAFRNRKYPINHPESGNVRDELNLPDEVGEGAWDLFNIPCSEPVATMELPLLNTGEDQIRSTQSNNLTVFKPLDIEISADCLYGDGLSAAMTVASTSVVTFNLKGLLLNGNRHQYTVVRGCVPVAALMDMSAAVSVSRAMQEGVGGVAEEMLEEALRDAGKHVAANRVRKQNQRKSQDYGQRQHAEHGGTALSSESGRGTRPTDPQATAERQEERLYTFEKTLIFNPDHYHTKHYAWNEWSDKVHLSIHSLPILSTQNNSRVFSISQAQNRAAGPLVEQGLAVSQCVLSVHDYNVHQLTSSQLQYRLGTPIGSIGMEEDDPDLGGTNTIPCPLPKPVGLPKFINPCKAGIRMESGIREDWPVFKKPLTHGSNYIERYRTMTLDPSRPLKALLCDADRVVLAMVSGIYNSVILKLTKGMTCREAGQIS